MNRALALAAVAAMSLGAGAARAGPFDDPYDLPDAPRPPVLPELTHPDLEATLESTVGALTPRAGLTPASNCAGCGTTRGAYVQTISVEVPILARRTFVGAAYDIAAGGGSGLNERFVPGNLELYGRTVWATSTGLAFGGGLAVILPTADYDTSSESSVSVAQTAQSLRPWDLLFFADGSWAVRPFIDVRDIVGKVTIQFREGLDISSLSSATRDFADYRFTARADLYVGYRVAPLLGLGVEAIEVYTIAGPTSFNPNVAADDSLRSTVVVSPSMRLMTPWFQPALSGFTSVGPPLYGSADRIVGVRLAFTVVYDQTTRSIERGTPGHGND